MTRRTCPNGHVVKDDAAQFCPQCGAPLPVAAAGRKRGPLFWIGIALAIPLGMGIFLLVLFALLPTPRHEVAQRSSLPSPTVSLDALAAEKESTPTQEPTPTPTLTRTPKLTATPKPTATPFPTATPEPTPTPWPGSREQPCVLKEVCLVELADNRFLGGWAVVALSVDVLDYGKSALNKVTAWNMFNEKPKAGMEYVLLGVSAAYVDGTRKVVEVNHFYFSTVSKDGQVYDIPFVVAGNPHPCDLKLMAGAADSCILPALRPVGRDVYLVYDLEGRETEEGTWFYILSQ